MLRIVLTALAYWMSVWPPVHFAVASAYVPNPWRHDGRAVFATTVPWIRIGRLAVAPPGQESIEMRAIAARIEQEPSCFATRFKGLAHLSPLTCIIKHTDQCADACGRRAIAMVRKFAWASSEPTSSRYAKYWEDLCVSPEFAPTLIVHDTDDNYIPIDHSKNLPPHWRNATAVPTSGLKHRRIARDLAVLGRATEFILGVSERAPTPSLGT